MADDPVRQAALSAADGGQLAESTRRTLRFYSLGDADTEALSDATLRRLREEIARRPTRELLSAAAELNYRRAAAYEPAATGTAARLYVESALCAYRVLFDESRGDSVNPFSSEFRTAAVCYNRSLERLLRLMRRKNPQNTFPILPGEEVALTFVLPTLHFSDSDPGLPSENGGLSGRTAQKLKWNRYSEQNWRLGAIMATGGWRADEIGEIGFASDYRTVGLNDSFGQEGVGVPVVVHRKKSHRPEESCYPPELTFPMTLFLRPNPNGSEPIAGKTPSDEPQAVLEFHDPFTASSVTVNHRAVSLKTDLTTPLALNFDDPAAHEMATVGLTKPELFFETLSENGENRSRPVTGLYFMQPYSPDKIPVILIHGLWSSPVTWLDMVNALESVRLIRENCQFWFYAYPTGLPWWDSAATLRRDLAQVRETLDPEHKNARLDETVLIGHSMGGLIARLQVASSGVDVWNLISDAMPQEVFAEPQERLTEAFFFEPNRSVRRVISIATPYRGSGMVNGFNERLAQRIIQAPLFAEKRSAALAAADRSLLKDSTLLTTRNSVESLSPDDPFFQVLDQLPIPDETAINNIIGVKGPKGPFEEPGDGVVERRSATLSDAESEITVESGHMTIHRDPAAIREVGRILLEHLNTMNAEQAAAGKIAPPY